MSILSRNSFKVFFFCLIIFPKLFFAKINTDSLEARLTADFTEDNFEILYKLYVANVKQNPDTALYYSLASLKIAQFFKKDSLLARAYRNVAISYQFLKQYENSLEPLEKGLDLWIKLDNPYRVGLSYQDIGVCHGLLGNKTEALSNYLKSIEYLSKTPKKRMLVQSYQKIGYIQKLKANYDIALDYYLKGLKIAEDANIVEKQGSLLNSIGNIYNKLSDDELALLYFRKSLQNAKKIQNRKAEASALNNIGLVFKGVELFDSALNYYNEALLINSEIKDWKNISINYNNIGTIYKIKGDFESALDYYFKSLKIKEERVYIGSLTFTYNNIGDIYVEAKKYNKALEFYNKSLNNTLERSDTEKAVEIYERLYKVYELKKDYKTALNYHKLYKIYNDTVYNEEMNKSVIELQTKYETEKKERENRELKIKEEKQRNSKIKFQIIASFLAVLAIMFTYLFYLKLNSARQNKKYFEKEKQYNTILTKTAETEKLRLEELVYAEKKINELQKDKIAFKNSELAANAMNIHGKSKLISDLEDRLEKLIKDGCSDKKAINELLGLIQNNQTLEEDWGKFKKQFEEAYQGFFHKLQNKFPKLTNNDLRICSYLMINLSTKEIAKILNVTIAAVNKSRQRLRKKLELDSNVDIVDFLKKM